MGEAVNHGIGYQFKIIDEKIKIRADADLKRHGLTLTQTRVMGFLAEMGGQATQKEIEEDFQVSHPTVVGLVSRMEQKGLVTTCPDLMDRRNKLVKLTERALEIGQEIDMTVQQHDAELLRGFSEEEQETLYRFLERINCNLDHK